MPVAEANSGTATHTAPVAIRTARLPMSILTAVTTTTLTLILTTMTIITTITLMLTTTTITIGMITPMATCLLQLQRNAQPRCWQHLNSKGRCRAEACSGWA